MGIDVGRSITYVFEDPNWLKKVAIGGLLLLIPIFGWLVVGGYWLRIIRRSYEATDVPLPEWDDFGGDFILGLKGFLATLAWLLPLALVAVVALIIAVIVAGASDAVRTFFGVTAVGASCLGFLYVLAYVFVLPLILGRVAVTGEVGPALDASAIIAEARALPVPLLISLVLELALRSVAGFGVVLCVIGVVFTTFLCYAMLAHIYGQVRRIADRGGATPVGTAAV